MIIAESNTARRIQVEKMGNGPHKMKYMANMKEVPFIVRQPSKNTHDSSFASPTLCNSRHQELTDHKYRKRLLITTPIAITPYKMRISSPSLPTMTISPRKRPRNRWHSSAL